MDKPNTAAATKGVAFVYHVIRRNTDTGIYVFDTIKGNHPGFVRKADAQAYADELAQRFPADCYWVIRVKVTR